RPNQFGLILRQLASLQASGGARLAQLLEHTARLVHRRSMILLFSDLLEPSESVVVGLKQLRFLRHEVMVFQVFDRDEIEFSFGETKVFEDLETGVRRTVNPAGLRERYQERFKAFMDGYRALFRDLEMPLHLLRTDENPWQALASFLGQRK